LCEEIKDEPWKDQKLQMVIKNVKQKTVLMSRYQPQNRPKVKKQYLTPGRELLKID
jgi:hypothetical protein